MIPTDIWISIFIDFLGLTSYPPLQLLLVCKTWKTLLNSRAYLSRCTLSLKQVDLARLFLSCYNHHELCVDPTFLVNPKHGQNKQLTIRESFLFFIQHFSGAVHIETKLVNIGLHSCNSCFALQMITEILKDMSPFCKEFLWHDYSLAKDTRCLQNDLIVHMKKWKCHKKKELLNNPNTNDHYKNITQLDQLISKNNITNLIMDKYIIHNNTSISTPSITSIENYHLRLSLPKQADNPLISSSNNTAKIEQPRRSCTCDSLSFTHHLCNCWYTFWLYLCGTSSSGLKTVSLKGLIFIELCKELNCTVMFQHHLFNDLKYPNTNNTSCSVPLLTYLETSFTCVPFFSMQTLKELHCNGSGLLLSNVLERIKNAPNLETLNLYVNPMTHNYQEGSSTIADHYVKETHMSQNSHLELISSFSPFNFENNYHTIYCPKIKRLNIVWPGVTLKLCKFLDLLDVPNLEFFRFDCILSMNHSKTNEKALSTDHTILTQHYFISSFLNFLYRNNQKLKYVWIDVKQLDYYLQYHSSIPDKFMKLLYYPYLKGVATSAILFNTVFSSHLSCPKLCLFHCLRVPYIYVESDISGTQIIQETIQYLNCRPLIQFLLFPNVRVCIDLRLNHIKKLKLFYDYYDKQGILPRVFTTQINTLFFNCFCYLSNVQNVIETIGPGIQKLGIFNPVDGKPEDIIGILNACPNICQFDIANGRHMNELTLAALNSKNLILMDLCNLYTGCAENICSKNSAKKNSIFPVNQFSQQTRHNDFNVKNVPRQNDDTGVKYSSVVPTQRLKKSSLLHFKNINVHFTTKLHDDWIETYFNDVRNGTNFFDLFPKMYAPKII